ncbi:zinc ribbon domain-containing protein [Streptomyces sp. C]|uniref:zinc ribbon domain-containing protein n=1 Tax=Streptomyces sp. C TaxID=253839 RepID=UPI0001DEF4F8|nr:predicted protein [Streptomyces sp. C]
MRGWKTHTARGEPEKASIHGQAEPPSPPAVRPSASPGPPGTFVKVDRWFPSTQLCSHCGALDGPKGLEGLSVRSWRCACGARHDRDENAELNLRLEARSLVAEGRPDT